MILSAEEYARVRSQAAAEYPGECCGVVMDRNGERLLLPCRNIQDELHAKDPQRHPRDARTAYFIDPKDLLRIGRMEGEGYEVAVIYHSHVDAGAYFSPTDRQQAQISGEPTYPSATYLVTSVMAGRAEAVAAFQWSSAERDFVPVQLASDRWRWHERLSFGAGRVWERLGIGTRLGRSS